MNPFVMSLMHQNRQQQKQQQQQELSHRSSDPFSGHIATIFTEMLESMHLMHDKTQTSPSNKNVQSHHDLNNDSSFYASFTTSSSSHGTKEDAKIMSTNVIINGQKHIVTEEVITNPDGSVERKVISTDHEDCSSLQNSVLDIVTIAQNIDHNSNRIRQKMKKIINNQEQ